MTTLHPHNNVLFSVTFIHKVKYRKVRMNTGTIKLGGAAINKRDECCNSCYKKGFTDTMLAYTFKEQYCGCFKDTGTYNHEKQSKPNYLKCISAEYNRVEYGSGHQYVYVCVPAYSIGKRRKRYVDEKRLQPQLEVVEFQMMADSAPCGPGWLEISTVSDCQQAASELHLFYIGTEVNIFMCVLFKSNKVCGRQTAKAPADVLWST